MPKRKSCEYIGNCLVHKKNKIMKTLKQTLLVFNVAN
ncbi:unnamed protein product [Brassica napus]|uniref:(rape) hypothetical protein n=1 Tax=Brassica napus TaxID=3708 RepID=A0A816PGX3_BRANA|nr:unnamed protein product [Brassica napus]